MQELFVNIFLKWIKFSRIYKKSGVTVAFEWKMWYT